MPIYMNWGGGAVRGSVSAQGYESWIEVDSFQFEGQTYTGSTGKKSPSGQSKPALNSMSLVVADSRAALAFLRMAAGQQPPTPTVTIVVVKPSQGTPRPFEIDLSDVLVTGASMEGQSAAVTLNFQSFATQYS